MNDYTCMIGYQIDARKTAIYPNIGNNIEYPVLGLCGEVGEIANKVKKISRDDNGIITEQRRNDLISELGDVLWYLSNICDELEISLDIVAEENIKKLGRRLKSNKLKGSGDNR